MSERFRLPGHTGRELQFSFDGKRLTGREGDTLAAALLANGCHHVARSFKYHRPRGIVTAGVEEPSGIVAVGDGARLDTNMPATEVALTHGLAARSLNAWPSLRWDFNAVFGWFGRFIPAGFYYKTFFWPNWHFFEGPIRRAAGLGVAPTEADPDRYERPHLHCDLLIVGSGPAGLAAALTAARAGADVVLAEQEAEFGGSLIGDDRSIGATSAQQWAKAASSELAALPHVRLMPRTSVTAYHDHNLLLALEHCDGGAVRQKLWHIRARQVVLATGAFERPLVFPGNDRPGIMLASAVAHYARRHRVAAGSQVVVVTNNSSGYASARAMVAAGVHVVALIDNRADAAETIEGVEVHRGAVIAGTRGKARVKAVIVRSLDGAMRKRIACDAVAMAGGWSPAVQLFSQSGGKLRYDDGLAAFVPDRAVQPVQVAGAASGAMGLSGCLASGVKAVASVLGQDVAVPVNWHVVADAPYSINPIWQVPDGIAEPGKQWVDYHNDVTHQDIALAAREGFRSVEHLKRYTTLGMAPDQGKTSNVNGLAIMGDLVGLTPGAVGTTTFRPPFTPISFGAVAGRDRGMLNHPSRRLPTHDVQAAYGAYLEDYGAWLRPSFYSTSAETMVAAIDREVRAVRSAVGILDYSPLGKIEVAGPDALEFLNQMVATNLATLKPGRSRYSLTLTEGGTITDDGVISRLADDVFLMGTTSGAADRLHATFDEWYQREYPELRVWLNNVTTQWAVLMLTGPNARTLLSRTGVDIDLSPEAFPHMTLREGRIGGAPVRINRVSFTGEVSFEIALPRHFASDLWGRFFRLGANLGLTPVGIEALDVLRVEKGFIHIGGDTDGTTVPDDVGYGGMVRNKKSDFIGRRSLSLPEATREGRLQLVGLRPLDGTKPLAIGAQLLTNDGRPRTSGLGHVTSSVWSPTLGKPIALGLLANGRARIGERLDVWHDSALRPVEVIEPERYDPEGALLDG